MWDVTTGVVDTGSNFTTSYNDAGGIHYLTSVSTTAVSALDWRLASIFVNFQKNWNGAHETIQDEEDDSLIKQIVKNFVIPPF